jgi:hypothetical protein
MDDPYGECSRDHHHMDALLERHRRYHDIPGLDRRRYHSTHHVSSSDIWLLPFYAGYAYLGIWDAGSSDISLEHHLLYPTPRYDTEHSRGHMSRACLYRCHDPHTEKEESKTYSYHPSHFRHSYTLLYPHVTLISHG